MISYLNMSPEDQNVYCSEAHGRLGLPPAAVEKDFWVCWALRTLFNLPELGVHLTFKGGTSLSKGWNLIHRFSEDIDVVIDRDVLGFGGDDAPSRAASKKQTHKRLKALRAATQKLVNEDLFSAFAEAIRQQTSSASLCVLVPDANDPDGQTLLLRYPTVFPGSLSYLGQEVKIELGARSDTEPTEAAAIEPLLASAFPDDFADTMFKVRTVSPVRTFLEKAMLLHEETFRPLEKKRKARMARHYYDLHCLVIAGIGNQATDDLELFERIAAHRKIYFNYSWVDYDTLSPGRLRLVPPDEQLASWRSDYKAMTDEMFFRTPPGFDELVETAQNFQTTLNEKGQHRNPDDRL